MRRNEDAFKSLLIQMALQILVGSLISWSITTFSNWSMGTAATGPINHITAQTPLIKSTSICRNRYWDTAERGWFFFFFRIPFPQQTSNSSLILFLEVSCLHKQHFRAHFVLQWEQGGKEVLFCWSKLFPSVEIYHRIHASASSYFITAHISLAQNPIKPVGWIIHDQRMFC